MTLVHPFPLIPLSFYNEADFPDHCVADTLSPTLSMSMCIFPFGKHGRNVFCSLCLLFCKFCLGLLISAPNSASADLDKPVLSLKIISVHIPLRIEKLTEPGF